MSYILAIYTYTNVSTKTELKDISVVKIRKVICHWCERIIASGFSVVMRSMQMTRE